MRVVYSVPKQSFQLLIPSKVADGSLALQIGTILAWFGRVGPIVIFRATSASHQSWGLGLAELGKNNYENSDKLTLLPVDASTVT